MKCYLGLGNSKWELAAKVLVLTLIPWEHQPFYGTSSQLPPCSSGQCLHTETSGRREPFPALAHGLHPPPHWLPLEQPGPSGCPIPAETVGKLMREWLREGCCTTKQTVWKYSVELIKTVSLWLMRQLTSLCMLNVRVFCVWTLGCGLCGDLRLQSEFWECDTTWWHTVGGSYFIIKFFSMNI